MRWVARQWGSWTERGVILNADGMLKELHKNGRYAGRLFHTLGAVVGKPQVPNDKLHRNRLAEADRKVLGLHGMCRCSRLE